MICEHRALFGIFSEKTLKYRAVNCTKDRKKENSEIPPLHFREINVIIGVREENSKEKGLLVS